MAKTAAITDGHDADDEGRPHPLEGVVEHVLAKVVRPEEVARLQGELLAVEDAGARKWRRIGFFHILLKEHVESRPPPSYAACVVRRHRHHVEKGDKREKAYHAESRFRE